MDKGTDNIASILGTLADELADKDAIIVPRDDSCEKISFKQLEEDSNRLADGLVRYGFERGDRVLLMVRPGIDFISFTFALFKMGAVAVLIDPGLGRKNMLKCIENVQAKGMIAIPLAHTARKFFPKSFAGIKNFVTVGRRWLWGGGTLDGIRKSGSVEFLSGNTNPDDPAAILFTSGSTGPSKGVLYTHQMFSHQVEIIRSNYKIEKGEIDLPTFPLFALFGVTLGMTCIIPDMDPTRPAEVDPEKIIQTIKKYSVTNSFGSPALWRTVSKYCLEKDIQLPTIKRILMAGAPVPGNLLERFDKILSSEAKIHTPYGATEVLPVATIDHRKIIDETWSQTQAGKGTFVGNVINGLDLKIIKITDEPITSFEESLLVNAGEIGEIIVRSPWASPLYFHLKRATQLAKIPDGDGFWHRMGDVGYLDSLGNLWFCGRKNHRVVTSTATHFTIPCEAIFNCHPDVKRSALVGINSKGSQQPIIIIEVENEKRVRGENEKKIFIEELLNVAAISPLTSDIKQVLFHPSFPVDIRHNAKISREKLREWAEGQIK
ncbi:MAG: fatty acid CoA ligase family protein [Nitrospinales bacterium]